MLSLLLLYSIIGLYTSRLSDTSDLYHCIVISGVSHFRKSSVKSYKQITYIFYAPVDVNYSWLFRYDKTKRFRYFQGSDPLHDVLFLARHLQVGYNTLTAKATQTKIIVSYSSAPLRMSWWSDELTFDHISWIAVLVSSQWHVISALPSQLLFKKTLRQRTYRPAWPRFSDNVVVTYHQLHSNFNIHSRANSSIGEGEMIWEK